MNANALKDLGRLGVRRVNYSTDDPWSSAHRSPWLIRALHEYDTIYSPRRSNLPDLRSLNSPFIEYLPFAFDPDLHFPCKPTDNEGGELGSDVLFVGGADRERVTIIEELLGLGIKVALYGSYWDRFTSTRCAAVGVASPDRVREATHAAKVALCLVRRSNRDGHVMRSFEMAAMGACMLVEFTDEHREIFGEEGEAVLYFRNVSEMVEKVSWLLAHSAERAAFRRASLLRVATEDNTYASRLRRMLTDIQS